MKFRVTLKEIDKYLDNFDMIIEEHSKLEASVEAVVRYYDLVESKIGIDDKDIDAIAISNKFNIEEM